MLTSTFLYVIVLFVSSKKKKKFIQAVLLALLGGVAMMQQHLRHECRYCWSKKLFFSFKRRELGHIEDVDDGCVSAGA